MYQELMEIKYAEKSILAFNAERIATTAYDFIGKTRCSKAMMVALIRKNVFILFDSIDKDYLTIHDDKLQAKYDLSYVDCINDVVIDLCKELKSNDSGFSAHAWHCIYKAIVTLIGR